MKRLNLIALIYIAAACGNRSPNSIELITASSQQNLLFENLITVTQHTIPDNKLNDSLSFLILPVQASCPSCRKKTIDSIIKYEHQLADNHYIIISAEGGRKTIRGYFQEQNYELPVLEKQFFLDSNNLAYKYKLYEDKPTIYYTLNKKAVKKVSAIPATVREDLREFFSGYRELTE